MHEMAVTESIASICLRHAERHGARRILRVNIRLGELTGIVDRYVAFYWDMVTKDTIAEGASLNFTRVPVKARCNLCGREYPVGEDLDLTCPGCGEVDSDIVSGKEFTVESIEIE
ncbi:MAG: hydrogenase maturation nickel metallochaperone HypA [Candidatus Geothermincolales bacterium]